MKAPALARRFGSVGWGTGAVLSILGLNKTRTAKLVESFLPILCRSRPAPCYSVALNDR
jgi:hypothetical protein